MDPSTEASLLTYCFGRTGQVKYWAPWMPFPSELIDVANHPEKYRFVAWNIEFDHLIWSFVLPRQFPLIAFEPVPVSSIEDCMALSNVARTGGALATCAAMLNLPYNKDPRGRQIMLKQCKPDRYGNFPVLTQAEWQDFIRYGVVDTMLLRDCYYRLPKLAVGERYAFEWTLRRNLRGLKLDVDLIKVLDYIVKCSAPHFIKEYEAITGGIGPKSSKSIEWFKQFYPWISSLDAENMDDLMMDETPVPDYVRRALTLKYLVGSSSTAKLETALDMQYKQRIYQILVFSKAQTKRWTGSGLQVQNFPRVDLKNAEDPIPFDLNVDNLAEVVLNHYKTVQLKNPLEFVKNLLRRIFIADNYETEMITGDWSKIEPTVLFWYVGLGAIPKKWYEETAAAVYNMEVGAIGKDSFERQIGKMANLSCQYGTGADSFIKACKKQAGIVVGMDLAKKTVKGYRNKYPEIVRFWDDLEQGFYRAINGETSSVANGKLIFEPMTFPTKGVRIRLPSGNYLYYPNARLMPKDNPYSKRVELALCYDSEEKGRVKTKFVYGGLLCENVTSATARDIIVPAIWRMEQAGIDVLNLIHDEIWGLALRGRESDFKELMCVRPKWCPDMNIEAEVGSGRRYLK